MFIQFKKVGAVSTLGAAALTGIFGLCQETIIIDALVAGYWYVGYHDLNQKSHALLRNFPVC